MRVRFPLRAPKHEKKPLVACFHVFSEVREEFPAPRPFLLRKNWFFGFREAVGFFDEGVDLGVVGGLFGFVKGFTLTAKVSSEASAFGGIPENSFTRDIFVMPGLVKEIEMN